MKGYKMHTLKLGKDKEHQKQNACWRWSFLDTRLRRWCRRSLAGAISLFLAPLYGRAGRAS